MRRLAVLLLTFLGAFAANENTWSKVKELKSGTEIRVLKKGSMQPVLGKFDEANDENLILVVKNEQIAIPRDQIDRLDYRPPQPASHVVKETRTKVEDPKPGEPQQGMNHQSSGPGYSSSTSLNIQG